MVGEHGNEFNDRNLFLQLALGLLSATRMLDDVLVEYGRADSIVPVVKTLQDQQLLEFVLGVISFRKSIVEALEHARNTAPPLRITATSNAPLQEPLR